MARKSTRFLLLLFLLIGVGGLAIFLDSSDPKADPVVVSQARESDKVPEVVGEGLPAEAVEEKWVELARSFMDRESEGQWGPYRWVGDVQDTRLLAAFATLASQLDRAYSERLGLDLVGKPAETIFIFRELKDFRSFVAADPWIGGGVYAGYASAGRGFIALYVGDQKMDSVLATFAHELAHLVHRRALGPNLQPWLSEGLADALGDSATEVGFLSVAKKAGEGVQASRLRSARRQNQEKSLALLFRTDREGFDQGLVVDYEQSALVVRFLLTQDDWAVWFRRSLKRIAQGQEADWENWVQEMGGWSALEEGFYRWLSS